MADMAPIDLGLVPWRCLEANGRLATTVRGHYDYYGITGNSVALLRFRHEVTAIWRRWLLRQRRDGEIA